MGPPWRKLKHYFCRYTAEMDPCTFDRAQLDVALGVTRVSLGVHPSTRGLICVLAGSETQWSVRMEPNKKCCMMGNFPRHSA
jgi:hypothetical protein